jgi:hypothetical protein
VNLWLTMYQRSGEWLRVTSERAWPESARPALQAGKAAASLMVVTNDTAVVPVVLVALATRPTMCRRRALVRHGNRRWAQEAVVWMVIISFCVVMTLICRVCRSQRHRRCLLSQAGRGVLRGGPGQTATRTLTRAGRQVVAVLTFQPPVVAALSVDHSAASSILLRTLRRQEGTLGHSPRVI